ncbi:hypothetical protein LINGRAHAP2_LOCUS37415 [Linum grandiflorum]
MYFDNEIESRRTTVWRYLVGEHEPYTASTALSHRITIPFYRFLHILFSGTINGRTDDNWDLVTTTEIDLLWEIAEKVKLHPGYVAMQLLQQAAAQKYIGHGPLITRLVRKLRLLDIVRRYAQTYVVSVCRVACSGKKLRTKTS